MLAPLADFRQTDRQRGERCGLGWLATHTHTHKNTITGDFADVQGLRNSNDNYLWNNVASERVAHRGDCYVWLFKTLCYPLEGDVFVNNGCQSRCREQASSFLHVPRNATIRLTQGLGVMYLPPSLPGQKCRPHGGGTVDAGAGSYLCNLSG